MKKLYLFTVLFAFFCICTMSLSAQQVPPPETSCTAECTANGLNISTGYDPASSSYQSPLAMESNWELIAVPSNAAITLAAPSWVIAPHPAWGNFPNSQWVSPFQNNAYSVNNPPAWSPNYVGPFTFRKCFCICKTTTVHIKYDLMVDDEGETFIDGIPLASGIAPWSGHFTLASKLVVDTFITLAPGTHCITVDMYNVGSGAMGFSLEGSITGASILSPVCCNGTGKICGTKLNDMNCDGQVNPAVDPGVAGFTIILMDALGNPIASAVTDAYGNYCFENLTPGNYSLSEVGQPGWTQTYPSSPGINYVTVVAAGVQPAFFGNCGGSPPEDPCDNEIGFNVEVEKCGAKFYAAYGPVPPGYQVASIEWTFGDGYSSTEENPTHYYTSTGSYTVCLKVTLFNGDKCCTRRVCRDIKIEKRCDGDCVIDAEIKYNFDDKFCRYDFSTNIIATGIPITSWFWDFGDGTTGTGSTISHQYATPGNYTVCVYLFGFSPEADGCCFRKFCIDIEVKECKGPDGKSTRMPTGFFMPRQDKTKKSVELKQAIILNQNVPNPFAESTVISYNIPATSGKAQIVFTTKEGKTVKTVDITEKGEGRIQIFADDLKTGSYFYTLIVDGKKADAKSIMKQ